jgi:hypothetical protein
MGSLFPARANRRTAHRATEDVADAPVVATFMTLQAIWREELVRSTYGSRQERRAWDQLIEQLTKLPPPEPL